MVDLGDALVVCGSFMIYAACRIMARNLRIGRVFKGDVALDTTIRHHIHKHRIEPARAPCEHSIWHVCDSCRRYRETLSTYVSALETELDERERVRAASHEECTRYEARRYKLLYPLRVGKHARDTTRLTMVSDDWLYFKRSRRESLATAAPLPDESQISAICVQHMFYGGAWNTEVDVELLAESLERHANRLSRSRALILSRRPTRPP